MSDEESPATSGQEISVFAGRKDSNRWYADRCLLCKRVIPNGQPYLAAQLERLPSPPSSGGAQDEFWGRMCAFCHQILTDQGVSTNGRKIGELVELVKKFGRPPPQVSVVPATTALLEFLKGDVARIRTLSKQQVQDLVCERLDAMGFESKQVGSVFAPDGGIDIVAWPKRPTPFPFLLATQVKHPDKTTTGIGPDEIKSFQSTVRAQPFNAGFFVATTHFTRDAQFFAKAMPHLVRLRDLKDLERWIVGNFEHELEWREIPSKIEVRPGCWIDLPGTGGPFSLGGGSS